MSSAAPPASADVLYSNGLRDINGRHYDLATQEFQDYLKFYQRHRSGLERAILSGRNRFHAEPVSAGARCYNKVIENFPKSFKLASARMRKGYCLAELGQKPLPSVSCAPSSASIPGRTKQSVPRPS